MSFKLYLIMVLLLLKLMASFIVFLYLPRKKLSSFDQLAISLIASSFHSKSFVSTILSSINANSWSALSKYCSLKFLIIIGLILFN